MKTAVRIEDWSAGIPAALEQAKASGAEGVVLRAGGPLAPEQGGVIFAGRVKVAAARLGVAFAGLSSGGPVPLGADPAALEGLKVLVDMAAELECHVVSADIGVLPRLRTSPQYEAMLAACREAGAYAAKRDCVLALETGPESVARLKSFTEMCPEGVGICFDPAALVMVTAEDEVRGVLTAAEAICQVNVADGTMLEYLGPERAYPRLMRGENLNTGRYFQQEALGQGQVRWQAVLAALLATGFEGYLALGRRYEPYDPEAAPQAVTFLRETLAKAREATQD